MSRAFTYVDEIEAVVEDAAQWSHDQIKMILDVLAPDGRAFGDQKLSIKQQLFLYITKYRGRPWDDWIDERVQRIMQALGEAGVSEQAALAAHPEDVAQRQAILYSSRMEDLLKEEQAKFEASQTKAAPSLTAPSDGLTAPPLGVADYDEPRRQLVSTVSSGPASTY